MSRVELSDSKCRELFGDIQFPIGETDPDFYNMMKPFIYGEVYFQGNLDVKMRELITLVVLTTNQTLDEIKLHVGASLNVGLTPIQIKEAVYQCAPYIGFSKTQNSINQVNEAFKERNISLPVESQRQTTEENRHEEGLKSQKMIFGHTIDKIQESTPENQKHIQSYLSAYCFGDIYTRSALDLKTRELLTLCILCALGGCENQVRGHIQGNLNMGNNKETLLSALTQCIPYIGFPRTLNALACINEMIPESK
jgi:4-carboxymuconolactone decarboxylase